ncbi:MAG: hypothetical protein HOJ64_00445 [Euryarchaeota archaeon]|jgi:hypothetical protein|nr:hypothetical protein [Euryarchaeota archaeon]MBT4391078.1 hypothetical protein [Euryarchaeota archaeon]MBT5613326.1 hypothetical protein [Euryarchaeota archaeon]MBT6684250.1 hypothetical protein [Euryarchaeota archaeon]MBT6873920.1 hypothetical protein [Euryarchaeota archaeon]
MSDQDLIAWLCSAIVIIFIIYIVIYEIYKRWFLEIRLASLDETLLNDDSVTIEEITDAPLGSKIISQVPAYIIDDE